MFLLIIFYIGISIYIPVLQARCGCNIDDIDNSNLKQEFIVSNFNEIIQGVDYQKLIKIKDIIFLQKLVDAGYGTDQFSYECPEGYAAPTGDQLQQIKDFVTYQELVDSQVFTLDVYYISSTQEEEWVFTSMLLDSNTKEIIIGPVQSYFQSDKTFVACTLQIPIQNDDISNYVTGLEQYDYTKCAQKQLSIQPEINIQDFQWIFLDGQTSTEQEIQFTADVYENETCGTLQLKIEKFGGVEQHFCHVYHTQPYINTADTSNAITQFTDFAATKLENVSAQRYDSKHFSSGSVPIAPKYNNGSYVMYEEPKEDATGDIKVVELDKDNNIIEIYETGKKGRPYDIVTTKFGFVFMARDEPHYLYITAYDVSKKQQKWDVTLINNGEEPDENTKLDQIDLGDSFGTTVMFNPHNGRLVNARERIFAVFAHYNFFGYYDNGSRNVHTGDSSVFLDLETGEKTGQAFTWSSSHSLYQQVLYDGKTIFTSVLGDAYPQSVKNHAISGFEGFQDDILNISDQVIEPDLLPGNGGGMAAGRIGGMIQIDDNKYIQVHSQRPATSTFGDQESSTQNKLALTYFNQNLEFDSEVVLKPGNLIQTIKSAKYGDHIIIAYTTIPDPGQDFFQARIQNTDSMHVLLVDFNGNIVQDFDVSESSVLSAADDWEILTDGSVIFSFVNSETNELTIYKTDSLVDTNRETIDSQCNPDPIKNNFIDPNSQNKQDDNNDQNNNQKDEDGSGISGGIIALIVIIIIIVIVIIVGLLYYFLYYKKNKNNKKYQDKEQLNKDQEKLNNENQNKENIQEDLEDQQKLQQANITNFQDSKYAGNVCDDTIDKQIIQKKTQNNQQENINKHYENNPFTKDKEEKKGVFDKITGFFTLGK